MVEGDPRLLKVTSAADLETVASMALMSSSSTWARRSSTKQPRTRRWEAEGATTFVFADRDLHADALPCFAALRGGGLRLGAAGNMHAHHEDFLRPHVDFVGSSERWGVEKPAAASSRASSRRPAFPPSEIVYVGDRVDNDVVPALAAGIRAVRIRRGAHADVESPAGITTIDIARRVAGGAADA